MIANSIALHDLADEWNYEPDLLLSDRIRELENDVLREPDNHFAEERLAEDRQRFHAAQLASAGRIHRTAIALADVARKATGTGYYADL